MKIAILGYSGGGKSTLAKYLQAHYDIPLLYLDSVQFEADWKERDRAEALSMVADFMRNRDWIIDGNYPSFLQAERLEQADHIIYLAFSRWNCLLRACRRYRRHKNTSRESMAAGCNEKMDLEFVWWILYQGRTPETRRRYNAVLHQYGDKAVVLKNQRELDAFMENPFGRSFCDG